MSAPLVLILGGTRSGKSRFGRDRASALAAAAGSPDRVVYLATALPGDPELDERISLHRHDRPAAWTTVEVGADLAGAIGSADRDAILLLDGLTLWVSLALGDAPAPVGEVTDGPIAAVLEALRSHRGPAVVVSDEVGLGLVPMDPVGRAFRDVLGIAHQRIALDADEVWFMVAGRPLAVPRAPAP